MDTEILEKNGVNPKNARIAYLPDYGLRIGERATLIPSQGEIAYGLVMQASEAELERLYSEQSVSDYVPEQVQVLLENDQIVNANCYNLPAGQLTGSNTDYAKALLELTMSLDFPHSYLDHISKIADSN